MKPFDLDFYDIGKNECCRQNICAKETLKHPISAPCPTFNFQTLIQFHTYRTGYFQQGVSSPTYTHHLWQSSFLFCKPRKNFPFSPSTHTKQKEMVRFQHNDKQGNHNTAAVIQTCCSRLHGNLGTAYLFCSVFLPKFKGEKKKLLRFCLQLCLMPTVFANNFLLGDLFMNMYVFCSNWLLTYRFVCVCVRVLMYVYQRTASFKRTMAVLGAPYF